MLALFLSYLEHSLILMISILLAKLRGHFTALREEDARMPVRLIPNPVLVS